MTKISNSFRNTRIPSLLHRVLRGYRARRLRDWYYTTFYNRPRVYTVRYNDITGPYKLVMRIADGPGMRRRLRKGTELHQRRIFLKLLQEGANCCDIGAHVGDYTVEMALVVGSRGHVFSYEAVPHYFHLLSQTVEANQLSNVTVKLAAVGTKPGWLQVPTHMLTGSLAKPGKVGMQRKTIPGLAHMSSVPVVRLDDEIGGIDAIKIDCEGCEFSVLKGMKRLVSKNPNLIVFLEVHERQLGDMGSSLQELATLLLHEYAFRVFQIGSKHCICSRTRHSVGPFKELVEPEQFAATFHNT